MKNLIIKPRETDYLLGVNSPIQFKAVTNGDWSAHDFFNENQRNPIFDDDGCACYGANKSLDWQMDAIWQTLPLNVQSWLIENNYLEQGTDGNMHFHTSPRFTENLTGNGTNGNSIPECLDVLRKYGAIPWNDYPFTPIMTQAEYFTAPTAAMLAKGAQFLQIMGGKNFCQYHWVINNAPKNVSLMQSVILQAPLLLGIAVSDGWNQVTPTDPPDTQAPQHVVTAYKVLAPAVDISDNYIPYNKVLDAGYPIHYCLQAVITYISAPASPVQPIPPAPTLPSNSSVPQELSFLAQCSVWLNWLSSYFKGRQLQGISNMNFSYFKSAAVWAQIFQQAYNLLVPLMGVFPNNVYLTLAVNIIGSVLTIVFHKQGVQQAAVTSAALGRVSSGQ